MRVPFAALVLVFLGLAPATVGAQMPVVNVTSAEITAPAPAVVVADVVVAPAVADVVVAPAVADVVVAPAPVVTEGDPTETSDAAPPALTEAGMAPTSDETPVGYPIPETPEEVGAAIDEAITAAQGGEWSLFAGFMILILLWGARRLGAFASWSAGVPWVALVVGGAATCAAFLASGYALGTAVLYAFFAGGQAIAYWELILRHVDAVLKKSTPEN